MPVKAILLDIEGTTTPIDFVHKTLFPFAKTRIHDFVRDNFGSLTDEIADLIREHSADRTYLENLDETSPDSASDYLTHLIDVDRKSRPLKSIQGMIWQAGYLAGELRSQIFDDVPAAFENWHAAGKTIAIYSSGSVLAQKNLFKYTDHGDLTPLISNYFDTNVGGKRESESYVMIAGELNIAPDDILFISDITQELDAAANAGMSIRLSVRPGNQSIESVENYQVVSSLADI